MNIIDSLNTLAERIKLRYPDINCGGCCVFAVLVAKELRKRGIPVKVIVAADGACENIDLVRKQIHNNNMGEWNDAGVYFNHVGIEFRLGKRFYHFETNDGVLCKSDMLGDREIYEGRLSIEEAEDLAKDVEGWNKTFNRKRIPSIRRHIRRYLAFTLPLTANS